jgi:hypothetical protein
MKIPIKRFIDDPSKSWEERFNILLKHHEEETKWLIKQFETLEAILDFEALEVDEGADSRIEELMRKQPKRGKKRKL